MKQWLLLLAHASLSLHLSPTGSGSVTFSYQKVVFKFTCLYATRHCIEYTYFKHWENTIYNDSVLVQLIWYNHKHTTFDILHTISYNVYEWFAQDEKLLLLAINVNVYCLLFPGQQWRIFSLLWPLLLTWLNFNPSMDKYFHPTHYNGCNYLSMLGLS